MNPLPKLIGLAAVLVLAPPAALFGDTRQPLNRPSAEVVPQDREYAIQTSQGSITLELRPRWEDGKLTVQIGATTHSGDLSQVNLQQQFRLVIESDTLAPEAAGSLSGHHAEATVTFPVTQQPKQFAIVIREVPDQPVRILTWPAGNPTP